MGQPEELARQRGHRGDGCTVFEGSVMWVPRQAEPRAPPMMTLGPGGARLGTVVRGDWVGGGTGWPGTLAR